MSAIPRDFEYSRPEYVPPTTRSASLISTPLQGISGFGEQSQITFPLVQRGFLVPNSAYVCATVQVSKTSAANSGNLPSLLGSCPATCYISRVDTQLQSTVVESLTNYNALYSMLVNGKMNLAQKEGMSLPFGLNVAGAADVFSNLDSWTGADADAVNTVYNIQLAFPLGSLLTNCEKYVPLSGMESRITFTVDSLANFSRYLSGLSVNNVSLHYDIIEFDPATEQAILMSQADEAGDLWLKSQSYQISSAPIAATAAGTAVNVEIPYASSLTSIKSLFTLFTTGGTNKNFGCFDVTNGLGSIQWTIAQRPFPETQILTNIRKPQAVMEFIGALYGTKDPIMAANTSLGYDVFRPVVANGVDTVTQTSKAYYGVNTETISKATGVMLSGVSSHNSNITLRVINNDPAGLAAAVNAMLIVNFDCIVKYNVRTRQVSTLR